ncbi:MAG: hypothetical protein IJN50_02945 [Clostridia bacterium]|nr:hypothetical protein [Clostridia bacterium]
MTTTKKVLALVLALIIALAFTACGTSTDTSNTGTAPTTIDPTPNGMKVVELPSVDIKLSLAFSEISEDEKEEYKQYLLSTYFHSLREYYPQKELALEYDYSKEYEVYYPIRFSNNSRVPFSGDIVMGVDLNGYLVVSWLSSENFGSAIVVEENLKEYEEVVLRSPNCWVVYNSLSGELLKYHLFNGEEPIGFVPKGSKYVGASNRYDLYFQSEDKIYQMDSNGVITLLAQNVDFVIDCDYDLTVDAPSEPLFMMKDGTVKAYLYYKEGGSLVDPRDYRDYLK